MDSTGIPEIFGRGDISGGVYGGNGKVTGRFANAALETNQHRAVQEVDSLIARDLFNLSLREREEALEDVHAIRKSEEDPNFVNSRLVDLEAALSSIKGNSVYAEAEKMSESFVRNRHFRVMFLRAEHYDVIKAAERLLKFFEKKKRLFGATKLVQRITMEDLSPDDMDTLVAGEGQISAHKDAAGRPIVMFAQKLRKFKTVENVKRACFYVYMAAMESSVAQTKGIVGIFYNVDTPQTTSYNAELRSSLPIVFASLHLCVDDITIYAKACASISRLSMKNRARYRLHFGSHVECLHDLATFGIPRKALPLSDDGVFTLVDHENWIDERRSLELPKKPLLVALKQTGGTSVATPQCVSPWSTSMPPELLDSKFEIRPTDVLFGRGKAVVEHTGNAKFRRLVDVYMRKYEEAERLEKICISEAVVQMVNETNGRFLKREPGSDSEWEEVDGPVARKKVAHAFRNRRKYHGYE